MKKLIAGMASLLLAVSFLSACNAFLIPPAFSSSEQSSSNSLSSQASSASEQSSSMEESSVVEVSSSLEESGESEESSVEESSTESSAFVEESSSAEDSSSTQEPDGVYNQEIVEYFKNTTGEATMYVFDLVRIKTSVEIGGTFVGAKGATVLTIDGGEEGAKLTALGGGEGAIKGADGATLVFKNLTIKDSSSPMTSYSDIRRAGYLEFGGKLRFENCSFECAAYFCEDTEAEFINCTFDSGAVDMYAVWVSDGSVSFKDCTFTGSRAIKLYEGSDNGYTTLQAHYDVENVYIEDCVFEYLTKKPGLAIDVFEGEDTVITIKNTQFNGCQDWTPRSFEGIDGVYESRTDTSTFTFVMEGVTVDDEPCAWETDRELS